MINDMILEWYIDDGVATLVGKNPIPHTKFEAVKKEVEAICGQGSGIVTCGCAPHAVAVVQTYWSLDTQTHRILSKNYTRILHCKTCCKTMAIFGSNVARATSAHQRMLIHAERQRYDTA